MDWAAGLHKWEVFVNKSQASSHVLETLIDNYR